MFGGHAVTEYIEPRQVETDDLTKVWSVTEFCARHRIDTEEQALLLKLFGPFATASELIHLARRAPRFS